MIELKPCPFCGGEAINDKDSHPIYCGACYSQMPYGICESDMIKLWNTRKDAWVSVDDKLPLSIDDFHEFKNPIIGSLTKQVLVSDGLKTWEAVFMMWFDNRVSGHSFDCIGNPTHWMPLPNPPKTDKQ